jgi:hypothetical protein
MLANIFGWISQLLYTALGIYPNDVDLALWYLNRRQQEEEEPSDYQDYDAEPFFGDDD